MLSVLMSAPTQAQNGFEIKRGVNVSHWLSQSQARGQARVNHIKEQDMIRIRELGFDHIRLPIDEVQFWDEQGNRLAYAWMSDMISIFNECNIAWTLWCYDADFGFWDQRTQDFKDKGMFDILMK